MTEYDRKHTICVSASEQLLFTITFWETVPDNREGRQSLHKPNSKHVHRAEAFSGVTMQTKTYYMK